MKRQIIYIIGDVHGDLGKLNIFIDSKIRKSPIFSEISEDCIREGNEFEIMIFQVGDFGYYWPFADSKGLINNRMDFLPDGYVKIYWCGGNHDDWDVIDNLFIENGDSIVEMDKEIYCCDFGATLNLADGKTVLFAGGAESIDKMWRISEMSQGANKIWWEQEGISEQDLEKLRDVTKADIVVSHTAPMCFNLNRWLANNAYKNEVKDNTSREKLDIIFDRYKPKKWYFGHFHERMGGRYKGCYWLGLADLAEGADAFAVLDVEGDF